MERFFLNLKMERIWQRDYANHGEAQADITDYIVGFSTPSDYIPRWATGPLLSTSSGFWRSSEFTNFPIALSEKT